MPHFALLATWGVLQPEASRFDGDRFWVNIVATEDEDTRQVPVDGCDVIVETKAAPDAAASAAAVAADAGSSPATAAGAVLSDATHPAYCTPMAFTLL